MISLLLHLVASLEEFSLVMDVVSNTSKLSSVTYVYIVICCNLISSEVQNVDAAATDNSSHKISREISFQINNVLLPVSSSVDFLWEQLPVIWEFISDKEHLFSLWCSEEFWTTLCCRRRNAFPWRPIDGLVLMTSG